MAGDNGTTNVSPLIKEMVSGISSGVLTILITHPLDLVKVRLQLSKEAHMGYRKVINDLLFLPMKQNRGHGTSKIIKGVYKGLAINLLGNSASWGSYFFLYRFYKDKFSGLSTTELSPFQRDKMMDGMNYVLAAWCAGFSTTLVTNPIWVLKTRIMSPNVSNADISQHSILKVAKNLYENEGFASFFRGLVPSLIGVSQGAVYFSIYDTLRVNLLSGTDGSEKKITAVESIFITFVSKIISTSLLYPIQTIKTNMQDHGMLQKGLFETIKNIYNQNEAGLRNLYRGLGANLARSLPATCITFYTYEKLKQIM